MSILAISLLALAQDPATLFTEGLTLVDDQTRFEGLADINGDGVLDVLGWWWVDSNIDHLRISATLLDGQGQVQGHVQALTPDFGTHVNLDTSSGSCLGDFDGDGLVEQVVLIYDLLLHMEFQSTGQPTFLPNTAYPDPYANGPSWSYARMAVADFTGDGVDDFALANTERLELWSLQAGAWTRLQSLPHGDYWQVTLDTADLTGDGQPDLALSYVDCPNNFVRIIPVAGGAFGPVQEYTLDACGGPIDVSAGDVDGDGDDDLVVFGFTFNIPPATGWDTSSHVLTQGAPGQWSVGARSAPSGPATALADIDGDGDLDGICCGGGGGTVDLFNTEPSTFEVCLNDGTGNFTPSAQFPGLGAHHVAGAMDFDGDGDMDLIAGRTVLLNTTEAGTLGCLGALNSTGVAAALVATGSTSLSRNDLLLTTRNLPPNQAALTFFGDLETSVPLANGTRCVGGALKRLPVAVADAQGQIQVQLDFAAPVAAALLAGEVVYVQTWYRDPGHGVHSNLSSSGRLLLMP